MTDEQTFADYRSRLNIKDVLRTQATRFTSVMACAILRMYAWTATEKNQWRQVHCHAHQELLFPAANHQALLCYLLHLGTSRPFKEYKYGMKESALVHKVCQRLLNIPVEHRSQDVHNPTVSSKPFDINDYKIDRFNPKDFESQKPFYACFKSRGIDFATRCAFHHSFFLASKTAKDGSTYKNLSFPMYIPGQPDKCVGLEERGYPRKDGSARKAWLPAPTPAKDYGWQVPRIRHSRMLVSYLSLKAHTMPWHFTSCRCARNQDWTSVDGRI